MRSFLPRRSTCSQSATCGRRRAWSSTSCGRPPPSSRGLRTARARSCLCARSRRRSRCARSGRPPPWRRAARRPDRRVRPRKFARRIFDKAAGADHHHDDERHGGLRACEGAREVLAGALLNMERSPAASCPPPAEPVAGLRGHLRGRGAGRRVRGGDALRLAAGGGAHGCRRHLRGRSRATPGQRARRARRIAERESPHPKPRHDDVRWCARESVYDVVGIMKEGVIRGEDV